jgi:hypothetical protein
VVLPVEASAVTSPQGTPGGLVSNAPSSTSPRRNTSAFVAWGGSSSSSLQDEVRVIDYDLEDIEEGEGNEFDEESVASKTSKSFASVSTVHVSPQKGRGPQN